VPKRYDVVVIGAGPAGLMAAKTLAEHGFAVALLDRKQAIAHIRRADGGAIGINEYLYDRLVLFDTDRKTFSFPVDGFSVAYDGPYANIYGFQIYSPGKQRILFGNWEEAQKRGDEARVGVFISKDALLQRLHEECISCGVDVFPGLNLTDIRKARDSVLVNCSGQMFEGSFVIAADGVNSRVVRLLGLNSSRKFRGTYRYLTWMLKGDVPIDPGSFNFIITNKGSYAIYDSYEKGIYHISAFSSDPSADLNEALQELIYRDAAYAPWFAGCTRAGMINCVSNILSPIEVPFKDNVLIIGDAAWTLEFSNMAALCNGWKAGNALTLALTDRKYNKEGIKGYLEWWVTNFYGPYGTYDFGPMGGGGTILQSYLSDEELDYLAGLIEKPFPATMNFFTLFNTLGTAYAELFPRVYDERPEIMDKLFTLRSRFDEIGETIRRAGFPNL
jgi:digeranylgeranylglycerophospholipid reductase